MSDDDFYKLFMQGPPASIPCYNCGSTIHATANCPLNPAPVIVGPPPAPPATPLFPNIVATNKMSYGKGPSGYGTNVSNQHAYQEALKHGWDLVIPNDNELQLDIDSDEQYAAYIRAKNTFERNIRSIVDCDERPSKSGKPGKYHIYLEIDMARGDVLHWEERIRYQLMLCSDPVREMLSWARALAGEPHPTLFFELPGKKPGMGKILPNPLYKNNVILSGGPGTPGLIIGKIKQAAPGFTQPSAPAVPAPSPPDDPSRYPHKCDKCGGPAYVGLFKTDCKNGCK